VPYLRSLSKERDWALDLRVALLALFVLAYLATRIGTSVLIAGFGGGPDHRLRGRPKRLSRQVTGVGAGFLIRSSSWSWRAPGSPRAR